MARLHRRLRGQRLDFSDQLTTALANTKSAIMVEDLSVQGMREDRHLARTIGDAGWGELRRMLGYKAEWYGSQRITAPRFHRST
jgi:putative transposase